MSTGPRTLLLSSGVLEPTGVMRVIFAHALEAFTTVSVALARWVESATLVAVTVVRPPGKTCSPAANHLHASGVTVLI